MRLIFLFALTLQIIPSTRADLNTDACGERPKNKQVLLSDLSQSPGPYADIPASDQGDQNTCYAMASAQFLNAFMSSIDRKRSGGCLPLEQITRERTYGGKRGADIIQTADYGHPILSVLKSLEEGQCCASQSIAPEKANDVIQIMNEYSMDVDHAEGYLHRDTLNDLYQKKYELTRSELEATTTTIPEVIQFQKTDKIYYAYSSSKENLKNLSDEKLNKIQNERAEQYASAIEAIQKILERKSSDFRAIQEQIQSLEKEQASFSPFVSGIAKENAIRKLEHALSPQDCIMSPTDGALAQGAIENVIQFSVDVVSKFPDGPMGFVDTELKNLCQKNKIPLNNDLKNTRRFVNKAGSQSEFAKNLKKSMVGLSPRPVLLGVCTEVLDGTDEKTKRATANYLNTTKKGNRFEAECGEHAVVLIGARWQGGQCQYLVRDSRPGSPKQQWVAADILIQASTDAITVR